MASTVVEEACRQICLAERQRGTERAETRRVTVLGRVVSCRSGDLWWRTKLDLGSGEPFDDLHGSATVGTAIKICRVFRRGGVFFGRWFWGCAQQLKAKRQKSGASAIGQEAEVTDTHEALRKDVE